MLQWDPSPFVLPWNLPLLQRPVLWYGVFFAGGFFFAYLAFVSLLKREKLSSIRDNSRKIADRISSYIIIGVLLGARLFDIIFYEKLSVFVSDPFFVVRLWEGGLSSHGGVLGLILAVLVYQRLHRELSFLHLLDLLSVVAGVVAACIRLGNFFNQEILGTPSSLPWAVVFGHPADGSAPIPRHPVQLYEALFYIFLFGIMWKLSKSTLMRVPGRLCGLFLVLLFSFRFFIEFFKEEQSVWFLSGTLPSFLKMGQWLSLPFIALGLFLLLRVPSKKECER